VIELEPYLEVLRAGGVVACATETFIGLLADARSAAAVAQVSALKGRDPAQPIGVLIPDLAALATLTPELSDYVRNLAARHWPGPLTLVVPVEPGWPAGLSKDGKIGARVPGPSPALALVRAFGAPLTATSANRTGQPAATTPEEVRAAFGERVAIVPLAAPGGMASTLVDVSGQEPRLLRAGPIRFDAL
jgi:L-threonylcarbamoyladenylate synthase